jgi:hypothetical protein
MPVQATATAKDVNLRMAYEQLLAELESNMLVTVLVPSKRSDRRDSDMIRVNMSVPPKWYRKLCAANLSSRGIRRGKPDTKIKRRNIMALLRSLAAGRVPRSKYLADLARIAATIS